MINIPVTLGSTSGINNALAITKPKEQMNGFLPEDGRQ
ncbi:hypothetical protein QF050_003098 [Arthrobacter sp. SLBN-112]|nr:hypothetical protein [Arthrobacter sp. SLBN-112]